MKRNSILSLFACLVVLADADGDAPEACKATTGESCSAEADELHASLLQMKFTEDADALIKTATTRVSKSDDDLGNKSLVNTVPAGYTDGGDGFCEDEETRQEFNAIYAKGKTLQECADVADSDPNSIAFDFAPGLFSECDIRYPCGVSPILEGFEWWKLSEGAGSGSPVGMGLHKNGLPSHCYVKKVAPHVLAPHVPAGYTDGGDGLCQDKETRQEFNALHAKGKTLQECADAADSDPNSIAFDFATAPNSAYSECDIRYPSGVSPINEGFLRWDPSRAGGCGSPVGMGRLKNGLASHCYVKVRSADKCRKREGRAVRGHNRQILKDKRYTEEHCVNECMKNDWCKAVDFNAKDGHCYLNDALEPQYASEKYDSWICRCHKREKWAIKGHNRKVLRDKRYTEEHCVDECLKYDWCKAADFNAKDGHCYLNDALEPEYATEKYDSWICRAEDKCRKKEGRAIKGHNRKILKDKRYTEEHCVKECIDNDWCKAADFDAKKGHCYLNDALEPEVASEKYDMWTCRS